MTPEEAIAKIEEMIAEAERNRQRLEGIVGGEQPGIWWAGRAKALREVREMLMDCFVTITTVLDDMRSELQDRTKMNLPPGTLLVSRPQTMRRIKEDRDA